jgi:hypothetical protein
MLKANLRREPTHEETNTMHMRPAHNIHSSESRRPRSAIAIAAAAAFVFASLLVPTSAQAANSNVQVKQSQIGTTYATDGADVWLSETNSGASTSVAPDAVDGTSSIALDRATKDSKASVFHSYGVGTRPTDVKSLLTDASYSYSGNSVNFQIGMFFTPNEVGLYGPAGTTATCTQAKDNGIDLPGQCYTVIKFDTSVDTELTTKQTVTLDDKQIGYHSTDTPGGWWGTNRVGQYIPNDQHVTLDDMLAQMASYQIYIVGVSAGSGSTGGNSHVQNLSYGGTSYSFVPDPLAQADVEAPPATTEAVISSVGEQKIEADTAKASIPEDAPNGDLAKIDPALPVTFTFTGWEHASDSFVDVYAYSSPIFLGTFPVVNGVIQLAGLDLSALEAGGHHIVLKGQTSNQMGVIAITVAVFLIAATGADVPVWMLPAALLLVLLGAGALVFSSIRRSRKGVKQQ